MNVGYMDRFEAGLAMKRTMSKRIVINLNSQSISLSSVTGIQFLSFASLSLCCALLLRYTLQCQNQKRSSLVLFYVSCVILLIIQSWVWWHRCAVRCTTATTMKSNIIDGLTHLPNRNMCRGPNSNIPYTYTKLTVLLSKNSSFSYMRAWVGWFFVFYISVFMTCLQWLLLFLHATNLYLTHFPSNDSWPISIVDIFFHLFLFFTTWKAKKNALTT